MNKILLTLIALLCLNLSAFAQQVTSNEDDIEFFPSDMEVDSTAPGTVGDPDNDDYAPVDDYLPLLLMAGIGVAFRYRKVLIKN